MTAGLRCAALAIDKRVSTAIEDDGLIFIRGLRHAASRGRNSGMLRARREARTKFARRLFQPGCTLQLLARHNFIAFVCFWLRPHRPGDHARREIRRHAIAIERALRHPSHLVAHVHPIHTRGIPVPHARGASRHPHPAERGSQEPSSEVIGRPAPGFIAYPDPSQSGI